MRQSNLKNALVNMMVHQMNVTAPQIQKLGNLFRTLDKDGNGVLTLQELSSGQLGLARIIHVCVGLQGAGWKPWDINRIVSALDLDSSGEIDYTGTHVVMNIFTFFLCVRIFGCLLHLAGDRDECCLVCVQQNRHGW